MIKNLPIAALAIATTALAGLAVADPAPATSATSQPAKPAKKVRDPNEVICKTIPEPGSRLGGTKTCLARADWEQQTRDAGGTMSTFQASHTSTGMGGH
jgi:hypothetical protein